MTFEAVIGQHSAKRLLTHMLDSDRLPHALLLLGAPGMGGLPLAVAFAQYVLCENRQNGQACGVCSQCSKTEKLVHPDLHFSYPTVGPKMIATHVLKQFREVFLQNPYFNATQWLEKLEADNKQGNIPVAETLEIYKKLSLKTYEGAYKILVLWLPEYLGKEGNRLLKLIEEPPENTLFLLVAENADLILPTILSRCQLIKLEQLSENDIKNALILRGVPEETALAAAHIADGDFNAALHLAETTDNDNEWLFLTWMRKAYQGNGLELVETVEAITKLSKEQQKIFLTYGLHFLRECLILMSTGQTDLRLRPNMSTAAQQMQKVLNFDKIIQFSTLFDEALGHIERNAHIKMLFLDLSIQVHRIFRGTAA